MSINKDTGEILVAGSIDREVFSWINLTVTATDSGLPARSSQTGVFIKVNSVTNMDPQMVWIAKILRTTRQ